MTAADDILEDEPDDRPGDVVVRVGGRDEASSGEDDGEAVVINIISISSLSLVEEKTHLRYRSQLLGHLSVQSHAMSGHRKPMRKKNVRA
jgi:hypothetical protein